MFFDAGSVLEDPATGSAAGALVAYLATLSSAADLDLLLRIGQGEDMGRPSLILARAVKRGDAVVSAHVGGQGVEIMHGTLRLAGDVA